MNTPLLLNHIEKGLGNKLKIILIHAFPLDKSMWFPQLSALSSQAHVIAVDMPGMGGSPPFENKYLNYNNNNNNNSNTNNTSNVCMQDYAHCLNDFMIKKSITQAIVGGCSWGGYIAFEMWRQYPQTISGLILANTRMEADRQQDREKRIQSLKNINTQQDLKSMAKKLMAFAIHKNNKNHEQSKAIADTTQSIANASIKGVRDGITAIMNRPDSCNTLSTITVPSLIIAGQYDWGCPVYAAKDMHQKLPNSKLEIFNSGHLTAIEQPLEVNKTISKFLCDNFPP